MLILQRKEGERIIIGDPANPICVIEVVQIGGSGVGHAVMLQFEARREVKILRDDAIKREEKR